MKIYLSGPMTGLPDNNYPAFNNAAKALRAMGYDVVNPAENDIDIQGLTANEAWTKYLRHDIKEMMDCDSIVQLDGWAESRGANLEHSIAQELNMPTIKFTIALQCADHLQVLYP